MAMYTCIYRPTRNNGNHLYMYATKNEGYAEMKYFWLMIKIQSFC